MLAAIVRGRAEPGRAAPVRRPVGLRCAVGRFRLEVTDVSWPPGHVGPVVVGVASEGVLRVGDELVLLGRGGRRCPVVLEAIGGLTPLGPAPADGVRLALRLGGDLPAGEPYAGQLLVQDPGEGDGVREPRRPHPLLPGGVAYAEPDPGD